jgi:hypothetical protein
VSTAFRILVMARRVRSPMARVFACSRNHALVCSSAHPLETNTVGSSGASAIRSTHHERRCSFLSCDRGRGGWEGIHASASALRIRSCEHIQLHFVFEKTPVGHAAKCINGDPDLLFIILAQQSSPSTCSKPRLMLEHPHRQCRLCYITLNPSKRDKTCQSALFITPPRRPFLCSQGCNGLFTHFYPATKHAIDLECPVGTAVLAGEV